MPLNVNMPGIKGYVNSSSNLGNIATILNNRKQAQQNSLLLKMKQEALDFERSAPQRAAQAEQAVFDITRQRNQEANRQRNDIVNAATSSQYVPSEAVNRIFATPEGGYGPQQPLPDGSASGSYSDMQTALGDFTQNMNDNPQLYQNPRQIQASIAEAARANGNFDESQVAAMQAQGVEHFTTLSPEAQKQAFSEAKTALVEGGKIFGNAGGSGSGTGNQSTAAINAAQTLAFEEDLYSNGNFDDHKGMFGRAMDAITFNFLDSPDAARNEIDGLAGEISAKSGIAKIHVLNALLSTETLRRDGNWDTEVSKIMDNPNLMAKIEIRAKYHESAANSKSGVSQSGASDGGQQRLQLFNQTNNAIRAGSVPTQNSDSNIEGMATDFLQNRSGKEDVDPTAYASNDLIDTSSGEFDISSDDDDDVDQPVAKPIPQEVKSSGGRRSIFNNQMIDSRAPKVTAPKVTRPKNTIFGRGGMSKAKVKAAVPKKTAKIFNSLTDQGKSEIVGMSLQQLQDGNIPEKTRKGLVDILSLA